MKGFRQFLLRRNVIDLAVGVVIGAAFGAVVAAFVKDLLTPLIAAIVKQPDFSTYSCAFCTCSVLAVPSMSAADFANIVAASNR